MQKQWLRKGWHQPARAPSLLLLITQQVSHASTSAHVMHISYQYSVVIAVLSAYSHAHFCVNSCCVDSDHNYQYLAQAGGSSHDHSKSDAQLAES